MSNNKKRFQKGQVVYQVSLHFCNDPRGFIWGLVVSRVVDACGLKQVTFQERKKGNDWVFGKSHRPDSTYLFADRDQALAYLGLGTVHTDTRDHADSMDIQVVAAELKARPV